MPNKIIVCMDGTTNEPSDRTNVFQIYDAIPENHGHVPRYIPGIASGEYKLNNLKEGVTGIGISGQILTAYREIVATKVPAKFGCLALAEGLMQPDRYQDSCALSGCCAKTA
jgi:hypothetical protein